jgi:mannosyltransferase
LGLKSFWVDEGVSADLAGLVWQQFMRRLWVWEGNMSLYYLLLRSWILLGRSDAWIRGLSVLLGVATLPCVFALGKRLFNPQTGLIAALLLAVNAFHIRYSQEARGYVLLALFMVVSTHLFVDCVESPTRKRWVLYAIVNALAVYVHFYAPLLVLAHLAALAFFPGKRIPWKAALWAAALYVVLVSPAVYYVVLGPHREQLDWLRPPNAIVLWTFVTQFTGEGGWLLLSAHLAACAAAFLRLRNAPASEADPRSPFPLALLALWLLLPIVVLLFASWTVKPIFVGRYAILSLPALVLLAAAGISALGRHRAFFSTSLLVILSLYGARNYFKSRYFPEEDWRSAAAYVVQLSRSGDAVLFNNGIGRPVFLHYTSSLAGGANLADVFHSLDLDEADSAGIIAAASRTHERVWGLEWAPGRKLAPTMKTKFLVLEQQAYPGVTVYLFIRKPEVLPNPPPATR